MKKVILSILAIILLVEEWLWDVLTDLDRCLIKWLHLESVERWLTQTQPIVAMMTFALPIAVVMPVEYLGLLLTARGQVAEGMALLVGGKLFSTLVVSWLFAITRPQLMTFRWFEAIYGIIIHWLHWAHERLHETAAYQQAVKLKQAAHTKLVGWLNG